MNSDNSERPEPCGRMDEMRLTIREFIAARVADPGSVFGNLDRWSQRCVAEENMGKIDLMFEAEDPVEHCFQNLIREIDSEAEMGVLMVGSSAASQTLQNMRKERGVSGELHAAMHRIAPVVFPDEHAHSRENLDLVWVSVQALYDRANFDARMSEFAMTYFFDSVEKVTEMTTALRSLFYSFYEDGIRRQVDMPSVLDETQTQELFVMISDLMLRAGSYEDRIGMIRSRAHSQ